MKERIVEFASSLLVFLLAVLLGGIFLLLTGHKPLPVYGAMFSSAFVNPYGLSETLVRSVPLCMCAMSVAFCLKASLWNVGAEGQFLCGCIASTWVALQFGHCHPLLGIPMMLVAGFLGGAVWASVAGFLKSRFDVNEILTTLLMNYIAIELIYYLVYGPWKDRVSNFPYTPTFHPNTWFPLIGWQRVHSGCFLVLAMLGLFYFLFKYTRLGFNIRVMGDNLKAAVYAGIHVKSTIFLTLFMAGGIAGLAGTVELCGIEHKLHHNIAKGYGYTAIIVAWLGIRHPALILLVSIFMAGLTTGGEMAQISHNIPLSTVNVLQSTILLFILLSAKIKELFFSWSSPGAKKDLPDRKSVV